MIDIIFKLEKNKSAIIFLSSRVKNKSFNLTLHVCRSKSKSTLRLDLNQKWQSITTKQASYESSITKVTFSLAFMIYNCNKLAPPTPNTHTVHEGVLVMYKSLQADIIYPTSL